MKQNLPHYQRVETQTGKPESNRLSFFRRLSLLFVLLLCCLGGLSAQADYYVDAAAPAGGNGDSWATAFNDFQDALDAAVTGDEIWVAKGFYPPSQPSPLTASLNTERDETFYFDKDLIIYGGFEGNETALEQRNLSFGFSNLISLDAFSIITAAGITEAFVLDGFTISGGKADQPQNAQFSFPQNRRVGGGWYEETASPTGVGATIVNCIFSNNLALEYGGAMFIRSGMSITNCSFNGNSQTGDLFPSFYGGGAVVRADNFGTPDNVVFTNCIFRDNTAAIHGGVAYNGATGVTETMDFVNCTFTGNSAGQSNSVLYTFSNDGNNFNSFINCVIWDNDDTNGLIGGDLNDISNQPANVTIDYTLYQETDCPENVACGTNNIYNTNPQFVNSTDLRLQIGSPAIDVGDNSANGTNTDITNTTERIINETIDMGAYETITCTDNDGDGVTDCDGDCNDNDNTVFPGAPEGCDAIDNNCNNTSDEECQGEDNCYADVVISSIYSNCGPDFGFNNPPAALGAPDFINFFTPGNFHSMGADPGTELVLGFTDNVLTNDGTADPDLFIYEVGPLVEETDVWLLPANSSTAADLDAAGFTPDTDGFYYFGNVEGATSTVDIDALAVGFTGGALTFNQVKLINPVEAFCFPGDGLGGPDIDAICALSTIACIDDDGDGFSECDGDCDDDNNTVFPGAPEICGNGIDEDCDGSDLVCDDDYCESYGESTQYEWIESIAVNGTTNQSGNDGGYGDYTDIVIPVNTGNNTLTLTPGFSGNNYHEYWCVAIDYNQNGIFEYNEIAYYNASAYTINGNFNIPQDALEGETRMRISMRFGNYAYPCDIFAEGEVEDYTVNISLCDNVTDGGHIGEDEVLCDGNFDPAIITSTAAASGGSGAIEYLWLKNTTTSTPPTTGNMNGWEMIPNTDSESYDPGPITETTWYLRCARRNGCVQYAGESNVVEKKVQESCVPDYCDAGGADSHYEWINGVWFNEIDNTSGNNGGYADFTESHQTDVHAGAWYNFAACPGYNSGYYNLYWTVWADWNQDGDFNDAGELLLLKRRAGSFGKWIKVPADALPGATRLRVNMKYGNYAGACQTFNYGETEDYTVNVIGSAGNRISPRTVFHAEREDIHAQVWWVNNHGTQVADFAVEHSTDGENFELIKTENNVKDNTDDEYYTFTDEQPAQGENFYRLQINYKNGTSEYSEIRTVDFGDAGSYALTPNPADEYVQLDLRDFAGQAAHIRIVDNLGKVRYNLDTERVSTVPYRIDLTDFIDGIYFVNITVDGKRTVTKKLAVNKLYGWR